MDLLAGLAFLPDRIHLLAEQFGACFIVRRLLGLIRFLQRLRVDVQGPFRVAELVDQDLLLVESVLDSGGRLGAVGDGYHHWRSRVSFFPPVLGGLPPIVSQQIVGVHYQIGERLLRLRPAAVQVVFHFPVVVDVVEAGAVRLGVGHGVVSDYHARGLDQAGLDGVVQAEIADYPPEQVFFRALPSRRSERRCGEVVAIEDAARSMNPVQTADPLGGLLDLSLGDASEVWAGRRAPCVVRLVVDDEEVPGSRHFAEHIADVCLVALCAALVHAPLPGNLLVRLPIQRVPIPNHDAALV